MTDRDTLSAALRTMNNAAHAALRASLRAAEKHPSPYRTASLRQISTATDKMVDDDA